VTAGRRGPPLNAALDGQGFWPAALQVPSPNQDARPVSEGAVIDLAVIHNISLPPGRFGGPHVSALFTNTLDAAAHPYFAGIAHLRVSAHFFIDRAGAVSQFVATTRRAWHAGVSCLTVDGMQRERCNDFSIGIELEGTDTEPFTDPQYAQLARLASVLMAAHPIAHWRGHSEIAPGRKTDPGPFFDWPRFVAEAHVPVHMRPA
jgi:N-acetyl-anhydromuramoyl-L-alanine amidase